MKACQQCDRRFQKTEHLLRHQRSHTGEKPFPCPHCDRRYGRSDVLRRHVKYMHDDIPPPNAKGANSRSNLTATVADQSLNSNMNAQTALATQDAAPSIVDCVVADEAPVSHSRLSQAELSPTAQLDKFMVESMLLTRESPMAQQTLPGHGNEARHPEENAAMNHGLALFNNRSSTSRIDHQHSHPVTDTSLQENLSLTGQERRVNTVDSPQISMIDSEAENVSPRFHQMNDTFHNLEPYLGADVFSFLPGSESTMPPYMEFPFPSVLSTIAPGSEASSKSRMSSVPAERFALVSRLWPRQWNSPDCGLTHDFRKGLVMPDRGSGGEGVFGFLPARTNGPQNLEWGIDDDQQQELMREFACNTPGAHWQGYGDQNTVGDSSLPSQSGFPSTRLLNLGLFTAFRQTHCFIPFVHRPTFVVQTTPNPVVFSLCLLGFVLLDADKTKDFVDKYLPIAIQKCCAQLSEPDFGPRDSMRLVSKLSAATLLLYAVSLHPGQNRQETHMSQMLYHQTIMVAQLSGLFRPHSNLHSITELSDEKQANSCLHTEHESDDDIRWKLWARIESTKRLVATLIMTDSWWSYKLGTTPLIFMHEVRYDLPCSTELFRSSSARHWKRLADVSAGIDNELVVIQRLTPWVALPSARSISPIGIVGLLSIVWIRILEMRHRMIPRWPVDIEHGKRLMIPGTIYATDESGKMPSHSLLDIYTRHAQFLHDENPNCVTLWHFLNLQLLVNVEIFESATGRYGVDNAHSALSVIASWSKTRSARRACLHAAGIYKAMNRQRITDGAMLHTESAVFLAALVLSLYTFMIHSDGDDGHEAESDFRRENAEPCEILDDVDWPALGLTGFEPLAEAEITDTLPNGPARCFIENNSPLSFMGTVCDGGYEGAQMILIEYANLLGDLGKGPAEGLGQILRIMSNSLVDMECHKLSRGNN